MDNSLAGEKNIYYDQSGTVADNLADFQVADRKLNPAAIYDFLLFGTVLPPHAIFPHIRSLFPGGSLVGAGQTVNQSFKDLGALRPNAQPVDYFVNQLDALLQNYFDALHAGGQKICLFLSGGVDSGLLASYLRPDDFCVTWAGWGEKTTDYTRARATAELFQLKNHLVVFPDYTDDERLFVDLSSRHFELFKLTALAYYKMASKVRALSGDHLICITGDNADTLAGSFGEVVYSYQLSRFNKFTKIFPWRWLYYRYRQLFPLSTDNPIAFSAWLHSGGLFPERSLIPPADYFSSHQDRVSTQTGHAISRFNDYILMGMLLTGVVRQMSGLRSIIGRELGVEFGLPFCSSEIVRLFLTVPDHLRQADHYGKIILKKLALQRGLPQSFIGQPKKGMSYGHSEYLRAGQHLPVWQAMEQHPLLNQFINIPRARQRLVNNFPVFDTLRSLYYYFQGHQDLHL